MYSGKVLSGRDNKRLYCYPAIVEIRSLLFSIQIRHGQRFFRNNYIRTVPRRVKLLNELHGMLASLSKAIRKCAKDNFPYRIDMLVVSICGVSFSRAIIAKHAGMAEAYFKEVSATMKAAVLAKLLGGSNDYIFMRILMLHDSIGSMLLQLPYDLKGYLLGFLAVGDLRIVAPRRKSLAPSRGGCRKPLAAFNINNQQWSSLQDSHKMVYAGSKKSAFGRI